MRKKFGDRVFESATFTDHSAVQGHAYDWLIREFAENQGGERQARLTGAMPGAPGIAPLGAPPQPGGGATCGNPPGAACGALVVTTVERGREVSLIRSVCFSAEPFTKSTSSSLEKSGRWKRPKANCQVVVVVGFVTISQ